MSLKRGSAVLTLPSFTSPRSCLAGRNHFRNSRVSASDVKPQGKKLWDTVDEVEAEQAPGMRLHSPSYPAANGLCLCSSSTLTSSGKPTGLSLRAMQLSLLGFVLLRVQGV